MADLIEYNATRQLLSVQCASFERAKEQPHLEVWLAVAYADDTWPRGILHVGRQRAAEHAAADMMGKGYRAQATEVRTEQPRAYFAGKYVTRFVFQVDK